MATVAKLDVQIGAKTDGLNRGLKGTQRNLNNFGKSVNKLGVRMLAAFSVVQIGKFLNEATKLEGQIQSVERAFARLGDKNLLEDLQRATGNTVNQLELMQQAVMASNFRIPMKTLTAGLEFATLRAKETGQEIDFLVNSFTVGLGRRSIMILDNLGLSMIEIQKEVKKVGDFSVAVGNIIEREMAKAGKSIRSSADRTAELGAEFTNLKIEIGEKLNPAFDTLKERMTEGLKSLTKILNEETIPAWQKWVGLVTPSVKRKAFDSASALAAAREELEFLKDIDKLNLENVAETVSRLYGDDKRLRKFTGDLVEYGKALFNIADAGGGDAGDKITKIVTSLSTLREELKGINALMEGTDISDTGKLIALQDMRAEIETQIAGLEGLSLAQKKALNPPLDGLQGLKAELLDVTDAVAGVSTAIEETGNTWESTGALTWRDMIEVTDSLRMAMEGMFIGIGEAIGDLISSSSGIEGFFLNLLDIIAQFAALLGKVLIAAGIAFVGSGFFAGAGAALIAAGTGLTILGQVGSNLIQKQNVNVSGQLRVSGNDLVTVVGRGGEFRSGVT